MLTNLPWSAMRRWTWLYGGCVTDNPDRPGRIMVVDDDATLAEAVAEAALDSMGKMIHA